MTQTKTPQHEVQNKRLSISLWILPLLIAGLGGCDPVKPTSMIVGTWKAPNANQSSKEAAGMKSGKAPDIVNQQIQSVIASRVTITFLRNNNFELQISGPKLKGQWSYDEKLKVFLLQNKKSNETAERHGASGVKMKVGSTDTWVVYLDADKREVELFLLDPGMAASMRALGQFEGKPKGYILAKQ